MTCTNVSMKNMKYMYSCIINFILGYTSVVDVVMSSWSHVLGVVRHGCRHGGRRTRYCKKSVKGIRRTDSGDSIGSIVRTDSNESNRMD